MNIVLEKTEFTEAVDSWKSASWICYPHSSNEYDHLARFLDYLLDTIGKNENHYLYPLLETVEFLIAKYDEENVDFKEQTPENMLNFIIDQYDLKQKDLAKYLGGQSVVSEILSGNRKLNRRQIEELSLSFKIPISAFWK